MVNEIEFLPKKIEIDNKIYQPKIYLTAWDKWCIAYKNIVKPSEYLCSVVIEPENEPIKIEDTIGWCLNEYVGNAKTFGDAVTMLIKYLKRYEA